MFVQTNKSKKQNKKQTNKQTKKPQVQTNQVISGYVYMKAILHDILKFLIFENVIVNLTW